MAATLGIDLKKEEIRWTALEGNIKSPRYVSHGRKKYALTADRGQLANNFNRLLLELTTEIKPIAIGYKVSLNAKSVDQNAYLIMPLGILGLICANNSIKISEYNSSSFTPKRFNLIKGTDPASLITEICGKPAPHWDSSQIYSALSAWATLSV